MTGPLVNTLWCSKHAGTVIRTVEQSEVMSRNSVNKIPEIKSLQVTKVPSLIITRGNILLLDFFSHSEAYDANFI